MPKKEPETLFRFELDGEILEIDAATLTFREAAFLEPYVDQPVNERWAMATIAKHRKSSGLSLEEVMDDLGDIEIQTMKDAPKSKRPTKAAPDDSGTQD